MKLPGICQEKKRINPTLRIPWISRVLFSDALRIPAFPLNGPNTDCTGLRLMHSPHLTFIS
jgi:hypothetical protein